MTRVLLIAIFHASLAHAGLFHCQKCSQVCGGTLYGTCLSHKCFPRETTCNDVRNKCREVCYDSCGGYPDGDPECIRVCARETCLFDRINYCVANVFGCNATPCRCTSLLPYPNVTECENFEGWQAQTLAQKIDTVSESLCTTDGGRVSLEWLHAAEKQAAENAGQPEFNCIAFNAAFFDPSEIRSPDGKQLYVGCPGSGNGRVPRCKKSSQCNVDSVCIRPISPFRPIFRRECLPKTDATCNKRGRTDKMCVLSSTFSSDGFRRAKCVRAAIAQRLVERRDFTYCDLSTNEK